MVICADIEALSALFAHSSDTRRPGSERSRRNRWEVGLVTPCNVHQLRLEGVGAFGSPLDDALHFGSTETIVEQSNRRGRPWLAELN